MARGIDLSIPAIITLSSTMILGFSRGRDEYALAATVVALFFAALIGLANGVLVAVFKLNALIVTLAVGAITSGATLWYRESLPAESRVPPEMAEWGDARILGFNIAFWVSCGTGHHSDRRVAKDARSAGASRRSGPIHARPGSQASTSPFTSLRPTPSPASSTALRASCSRRSSAIRH